MEESQKLMKHLKKLIFHHLVISSSTIFLWTFQRVFFVKGYEIMGSYFDPFEIFLYIFNLGFLFYLLGLNIIKKPHLLIKDKVNLIMECSIWSIGMLMVYGAMKIGVEKSLASMFFYIPPNSDVIKLESIVVVTVTVFPIFLFAYVISILYSDFHVFRLIKNCEYLISIGRDLDTLLHEEQQTEEEFNRN